MLRINRLSFAVVSSVAMLAACKPAPEAINVTPENVQLTEKGATAALSSTPVDKNGGRVEGVTLTWSSGDAAVASVDNSGTVTAVGSGSTTVTVRSDKLSKDVPVTVSLPSTISLDKTTLALTPEMSSDMVTASVKDEKGGAWMGQPTIVWASGDPAIATVENGKVTAVGSGSTTVTASFNELKAEVAVTSMVMPAAPMDGMVPAPGTEPGAAPAAGTAPAEPVAPTK